MKKLFFLVAITLLLAACKGGEDPPQEEKQLMEVEQPRETKTGPENVLEMEPEDALADSHFMENLSWEQYFAGINGGIVFYTPETGLYEGYNKAFCETQASPCSTFKIISALMGLEEGVVTPADSLIQWSGDYYWNGAWNQDMDLQEAFTTSCVWYFRTVIDRLGGNAVAAYMDQLDYGNKDIEDWTGNRNPSSSPVELKGFWLESSLRISPMEQTVVLEKIFEENYYDPKHIETLKQLMFIDGSDGNIQIYGKTGTGTNEEEQAHGWFVGFFEKDGSATYFAAHLADASISGLSGATAREITLNIIYDEFA